MRAYNSANLLTEKNDLVKLFYKVLIGGLYQ